MHMKQLESGETMHDRPPGGQGELDQESKCRNSLGKDRFPSTVSVIQDDKSEDLCVQR